MNTDTLTPLDPQNEGLAMLHDKVAVITGAGNGIGKAIARTFMREGARVVASDIVGAEATAAELGSMAIAVPADVTREGDVEALFARAIEQFGRVDILVNVAGNPGSRRGSEITLQEFHEICSVHLQGTALCCKYAIRAMTAAGGGAIVNISSAASMGCDSKISPVYSAAKAGVNSLTKSIAVLHGKDGIRANAIVVGFTLSEKNLRAPAEVLESIASRNALGRGGHPEEQAEVAAFLASERASFLTGALVPVDGGWTARLA